MGNTFLNLDSHINCVLTSQEDPDFQTHASREVYAQFTLHLDYIKPLFIPFML